MEDKHHGNLKQYVNDIIGMERDIANAIEGQLSDERLGEHPELRQLLEEAALQSEVRIRQFKELSEREGGTFGEAIKEGLMAVTGSLAGLYGKLREHPVSRMLRDDIVALDMAATGYGMLLTLGLSIGHTETAALAEQGLKSCAPMVVRLTGHLPLVVASEVAKDAPLANPAAPQLACEVIRDTWRSCNQG